MIIDVEIPHCLELEYALIGAIMLDPTVLPKIKDFIEPEDFYREMNRFIYESALRLYSRGEPTHQIAILVDLKLNRPRALEAIVRGSPFVNDKLTYLSMCIDHCPTTVHARWYAEQVKEFSNRRKALLYAVGGKTPVKTGRGVEVGVGKITKRG